jgi:hypothetical protein
MRIRYLWGHGRALRDGEVGIDGDASGWEEGVGRGRMGALFVGPGFMKFVMSSGVLAGVTLSMNCQAGSRRTMELSSEWFGMGMSEAESMSFCVCQYWVNVGIVKGATHSIAGLRASLVYRLHDAALLVGDIAYPVRLARRDNQMRVETLHMAKELFRLVNLKLAWVLDGAAGAVVQAFVPIYGGVGGGE